MTSSTPDVPRPSNEEQSTKRTFREMTLIRVGLGLGSAFMVQEFASEWGQHLSPTELYPLSLAVGMSFYNLMTIVVVYELYGYLSKKSKL